MRPIIDLRGRKFGKLLVLMEAPTYGKFGHLHWSCQCDCGTVKKIAGQNLRKGASASCGCVSREKLLKRITTHGQHRSRANIIWRSMITRCHSKTDKAYKLYGGRGIKVCKEWRHSFVNFLADMGHPPPKGCLERADNNKGYSKENCSWSNQYRQLRNTRRNINIEYNGEVLVLKDWAMRFGFYPQTLKRRLDDGWSIERALTEPVTDRWGNLIERSAKLLQLIEEAKAKLADQPISEPRSQTGSHR